MREPITARGVVAQIFERTKDAEAAVRRLRAAGFPDVRLSEHTATTHAQHVDETAGRTELDFENTLREAGFADRDAHALTHEVAKGAVLLTVAAGEATPSAIAALRGEKIIAPPLDPVAPPRATSAEAAAPPVVPQPDDRVIPVREEQLEIEKRATASEARVRRETVTEEKTITVPVRREELVVEREGEAPVRIPVADEEPSSEPRPAP